jgi:hypothetical protein
MYPHRIRLRGPWQCEALTNPAGARCRRRFGYPGRIDAHERVWLTVAGAAGRAAVSLNGTLLRRVDGETPAEWEVTALLRPRNELLVDVAGVSEGEVWGDVALEVRCTAYLRDVDARVIGTTLHVGGEAVGTAEGPLDLYVLLGRRSVWETQVTPTPQGTSFHLEAAVDPDALGQDTETGKPAAVQVDLVNGAAVWYTICRECKVEAAGGEG